MASQGLPSLSRESQHIRPCASPFTVHRVCQPGRGSTNPCRATQKPQLIGKSCSGRSNAFQRTCRLVSFDLTPSGRLAATSSTREVSTSLQGPSLEVDANGVKRVKYQKEGWKSWWWQGNKINYIEAGRSSKPPIVLVHGFGASAYHWRYIIPELAQNYSVYAIDLLGFGMSDKPSVVYNGYNIWCNQLTDFINEVVGGRPSVLVGNSMGAYASLLTSAQHPEVSRGLVLVNGAGKFEEVKAAVEGIAESGAVPEPAKSAVQEAAGVESDMPDRTVSTSIQPSPRIEATSSGRSEQDGGSLLDSIWNPIQTLAKRTAIYFAFLAAKQPSRIRQVLQQVYVSNANIDDDLVSSIVDPAQDPNAPDVFYRVISSNGASINSLLQKVKAPLFLLWGELDPWITPASADRIQRIFPAAKRVDIRGGHCPHDDVPELFLPPLKSWLESLPST